MVGETLTHRLILPRDANHHGSLYAGVLLSLALEAGYSHAYRAAGPLANLVLKRVLDVRCFEPVAIGRVVEIRSREVDRARAMIVVALIGSNLPGRPGPWMEGLMQFVQVDANSRPSALESGGDPADETLPEPWSSLRLRAKRLLAIRK